MRNFVAASRFIVFGLMCISVPFIQGPWLYFTRGPSAYIIPRLWQSIATRLFGIKVKIIGKPYTESQTIYISNHLSYLDIPVLAGVVKGSFVAKKDVRTWPVFGWLSGLQQTVFISRDRNDAAKEKQSLDQKLEEGKSLIIFPEGTSTDGRSVRPFKSSLFSLGFKDNLPNLYFQPITLKIEEVDGHQVQNQADRDLYAWHIDMTTSLAEHLIRFARSKGAVISIHFHPPVRARDFGDRKTLANRCYEDVCNGLALQNAA